MSAGYPVVFSFRECASPCDFLIVVGGVARESSRWAAGLCGNGTTPALQPMPAGTAERHPRWAAGGKPRCLMKVP